MEIGIREKDSVKIVDLKGEVDLYNSPSLRTEFSSLLKKKEKAILINLKQVNYIDSSGLATFVELLQKMSAYGGRLKLSGLGRSIRNVFEVSRLDGVFSILDSEADALKSFEGA
jgi:anti-sigma B factor antagonist